MKKILWISLISFFLGILAAAMIFVYFPEKNTPKSFLDEPASPSISSPLFASSSPQAKPDLDFANIADKVGPAVVRIEALKVEKAKVLDFGDDWPFDDWWERFFRRSTPREREYRSEAFGTGFLISSDGYILTNNHIVEHAEKVTVISEDEKEYPAEIVGADSSTDIALLKVNDRDLSFIGLGDSAKLRVGEWVLAIGNPLGFEHTVSAGIVSAKGRQIIGSLNVPDYQDFIQTDAAINRGNSGGPLVNMKGEVIGITSMIASPTGGNIGIGFAIPSNLVKKVVKQLKEKGKVVRGYLGVLNPQNITEDIKNALNLKTKKGALISNVEPGTPADKAGLKRYDVIVEIEGQPIDDMTDLLFTIAEISPETEVEIKVVRDGKEKIFTAKLIERPSNEEPQETAVPSGGDLGFKGMTLTSRAARYYGLQTQEGFLITDVTRYSESYKKGIRVGDIIIEANKKRVRNRSDLVNIIKKLNPGDGLILVIRREAGREEPQEFILTLRIPE